MGRRTGSIELRGGRYRVRVRVGGGRRVILGTYDGRDEAERILAAFLADVETGAVLLPATTTVATWVSEWMDRRELSGRIRGIDEERAVVRARILTAPFADWSVESVRPIDVQDWVEDQLRRLARESVRRSLRLLRQAFDDAVRRELLSVNPASAVRVPRDATAAAEDRWTWLRGEEIDALLQCDAIPERSRLIYQTAIYTGLRRGELFALRWSDVDLDGATPHLWVRRSLKGAPKSGRARRVPLLDAAQVGLRRWRDLTDQPADGDALVFPSRDGEMHRRGYTAGWEDKRERRGKGGALRVVPGARTRAGIRRPVRFHDLRHTCASHLVQGSWGRTWSLEEVREMLGHSTVRMTERYAHLAPQALDEAARATVRVARTGHADPDGLAPTGPTAPSGPWAKCSESFSEWGGDRTRDVCLVRAEGSSDIPGGYTPDGTTLGPALERLRSARLSLIQAAAEESPWVVARALDLAEAAEAVELACALDAEEEAG